MITIDNLRHFAAEWVKQVEALAVLRELVTVRRQRENIRRRKVREERSTSPNPDERLEIARLHYEYLTRESRAWAKAETITKDATP